VREHGGDVVTWEQALAAAREDVAAEAQAAAARRPARPLGCASAAGR
jgi:hypothetical protein